jgi:hypothetical protein
LGIRLKESTKIKTASQLLKRRFPAKGKNYLPAAEASGSGSQEPQTDASDENHGVSRDFQPAAETSISCARVKVTSRPLKRQAPVRKNRRPMLQTKITALAGIFSRPLKRRFSAQGKSYLPAAEASGSGSQEPQTDASDENHGVSRDFQPAAETSISGAR